MSIDMDEERKQRITLTLADVKPIALEIPASQEEAYRAAEDMVNKLWRRWSRPPGDKVPPHELLARVAFQFAKLYLDAYQENRQVNEYLTEFERKLDDLVVNT